MVENITRCMMRGAMRLRSDKDSQHSSYALADDKGQVNRELSRFCG